MVGAHRDSGADDLVDVFYSLLHSLAHVPAGSLVLTTAGAENAQALHDLIFAGKYSKVACTVNVHTGFSESTGQHGMWSLHALVAVPQLHSLVDARGGSRWHSSAEPALVRVHISLAGGVSARIHDLAANYLDDG